MMRHVILGFVLGVATSSLLYSFVSTKELLLVKQRLFDDGQLSPSNSASTATTATATSPSSSSGTTAEADTNTDAAAVATSTGTVPQQQQHYGKYCDPTVIGEKQPWNDHKKIISYSLFATAVDDPKRNVKAGEIPKWLLEGIDITAVTALDYYPDWIVRFHVTDLTPEYETELVTKHKNVELVRCKRLSKTSNARNMISRFLSLDDPKVWLTLVRDIDSRFTLRELMAVNEWIARIDEYPFHTMRDNPGHTIAIMGGTFGMRRGLLSDYHNTSMVDLVDEALKTYPTFIPGCCKEDQSFLDKFLKNRVMQTLALSHDSDMRRCKRFGSECREYPLGPADNDNYYFVGAPFKESKRFTSNVTGHKCSLVCDQIT